MSVFPIFNACLFGLVLLSLFTWNTVLLLIIFPCVILSIVLFIVELINFEFYHESGFWLFILSEVAIFASLFICCLYFDYGGNINLSSALELPFLGCFILLGSSVTVTAYHHLLGWCWGWVPLLFTILLGFSFVYLQISEFNEIIVNLYDTSFHASSLCTVGLHFSHVLLGVIGLLTLLLYGYETFGLYRCSILVWYWHFVDYVWLFVYTLVYVC